MTKEQLIEAKIDDYLDRIESLKCEIAELTAKLTELQRQKEGNL